MARMKDSRNIHAILRKYGVGRRKLDDILFINDKPPARLGIYDFDEEKLGHEEIKSSTNECCVPGCNVTFGSLLESENHYNASHRYTCASCKMILPSPHFLDLHLQEVHSTFFAVLCETRAMYCCYNEECKLKFSTANDRRKHCVDVHKLPKDFRYDIKQKNKTKKTSTDNDENAMSIEFSNEGTSEAKKKIVLSTSKQKTFAKYSGKKFTKNEGNKNSKDVNMDEAMADLKESLPE